MAPWVHSEEIYIYILELWFPNWRKYWTARQNGLVNCVKYNSCSASCNQTSELVFSLSLSLLQRPTVISSSLQWSSCVLLSERSRRNALAQEPETSWIPECGALQESPESPTWTGSRFPWQRRTNRRKHWGNPVILQHWAIINTLSGEGSRSWYSSNPYRALGRGTSNQNHCCSWCGCMRFFEKKGSLRAAA